MLIRDRIFQKLEDLDMTQKEFSEKTGIVQSIAIHQSMRNCMKKSLRMDVLIRVSAGIKARKL